VAPRGRAGLERLACPSTRRAGPATMRRFFIAAIVAFLCLSLVAI
jgi:hypothetical protein